MPNRKEKVLKDRVCMICGKKFDVKLEANGKIPNRYWFNKDLLSDLTGGRNKSEYWECEECSGFKDDLIMREKVKNWMESYWGIRCPDYEETCALCKAWAYYDYIFGDVETK